MAHACGSGVFVSTEGRAAARAEGGNIINVETSKALASDAGTVGAVFERIGRSAGPVSAPSMLVRRASPPENPFMPSDPTSWPPSKPPSPQNSGVRQAARPPTPEHEARICANVNSHIESGALQIPTPREREPAETVIGAVFDRLARSKGPVSDALNAAAVRIAAGEPVHAVRSQLLDAVRAGVATELGHPPADVGGTDGSWRT